MNETLPPAMIISIVQVCRYRYHSAVLEGKSEQEAFEEIVRTVIETDRDRRTD